MFLSVGQLNGQYTFWNDLHFTSHLKYLFGKLLSANFSTTAVKGILKKNKILKYNWTFKTV